jgi:hypothetical protein
MFHKPETTILRRIIRMCYPLSQSRNVVNVFYLVTTQRTLAFKTTVNPAGVSF